MRVLPRRTSPVILGAETGATIQNLYGDNVRPPSATGLINFRQ